MTSSVLWRIKSDVSTDLTRNIPDGPQSRLMIDTKLGFNFPKSAEIVSQSIVRR